MKDRMVQFIEVDKEDQTVRKILSRLRRIKDYGKKNKLYLSIKTQYRELILQQAILDLPTGSYQLTENEYGALNIGDEIYGQLGLFALIDIKHKLLRGMAALWPERIIAQFTHDMNQVVIK